MERRVVTVLFADLVGFTVLGERLDSEDVAAIQDRYFALVREAVQRHGGVLEKFIGDAAMAVFGVPRTRDDDPERAVRAGLAIVASLERLAAEIEGLDDGMGERGADALDAGALAVRVGIATGEVTYALDGPDAGRVTGDTVNTAARLQATALVNRVLISEPTALAIADAVELEPASEVALKGKAAPVRVAHVIGLRPERSRDAAMGGMRAPTLGREAELATLGAALREVRAGANETWFVVAPPGTGKSRLLAEFSSDATASATVWRGRFAANDARPFGGLHDIARSAIGDRPLEATLQNAGVDHRRLPVVSAAIRDLAQAGSDGGGPDDRAARFEAWFEAFDALAGTRPEVWLLEDLHWAGPDALAFLEAAHDRATPRGRLIVATGRPALLDAAGGGAAAAGHHVLELPSLAPGSTRELVGALVGEALPARLIERVVAASDGNCLFVEELLRSWVSAGLLRADPAGDWQLAADVDDVPVPSTVQAIYAGQLDDLPDDSRSIARRASVAGRRVPVTWLNEVGGHGEAAGAAARALGSLLRRNFLAGPLADPPLGDAYAYRHALLRDAAYASLARAERAALHARFAEIVERHLGDHADEAAELLATQYEAALDSAPALAASVGGLERVEAALRAATWLERAGERAVAAAARARAIELFRRSVDRTPTGAGRELDLARRERRLGEAIAQGGAWDEATARLQSALARHRALLAQPDLAAADRTVVERGLVATAGSLARTMQEQLLFLDAAAVADEALAALPPDRKDLRAELTLRAATARQLFSDDPRDVEPAARAALDAAIRYNRPDLELDARLMLVAIATVPPPELEALALETIGLAERVGRDDVRGRLLRIAAYAAAAAGRDAAAYLEQAENLAVAHGLDEQRGWLDYLRTEIAFARGEWDEAIAAALRALEIGQARGYHRVVVRTWHAIVPVLVARGRDELLERAAAWYRDHARFFPDSPYGRLMHTAVDLCFTTSGHGSLPDLSPDRLLSSFTLDDNASWLESADTVIRAWLERGEIAAAEQAVASIEAGLATAGALARGATRVLRARLLLAQDGSLAADAARSARAAQPLLRAVRARWWEAKTLRLLARAGQATPEDVGAARAIEEALGSRIEAP